MADNYYAALEPRKQPMDSMRGHPLPGHVARGFAAAVRTKLHREGRGWWSTDQIFSAVPQVDASTGLRIRAALLVSTIQDDTLVRIGNMIAILSGMMRGGL